MTPHKNEKVDVLGYDVEVSNVGLCVELQVNDDGEHGVLNMYPEESKRLRKALKRAEKRVTGK